jgi:hypothetical protein
MKIPPATREAVLRRDGYRCLAPQLDGRAGWCRDAWGFPITRWRGHDMGPAYVQMSHTKDEGELVMGQKAPTDPRHLISLCPFHHTGTKVGSNWEAANRWKIRRHLEDIYGKPEKK